MTCQKFIILIIVALDFYVDGDDGNHNKNNNSRKGLNKVRLQTTNAEP